MIWSFFKVPHRLMTFQLTRGIEVCVICGPSPSLTDLEPEVSILVTGIFCIKLSLRKYLLFKKCIPNKGNSLYLHGNYFERNWPQCKHEFIVSMLAVSVFFCKIIPHTGFSSEIIYVFHYIFLLWDLMESS